jgi:hypothetical protein
VEAESSECSSSGALKTYNNLWEGESKKIPTQ